MLAIAREMIGPKVRSGVRRLLYRDVIEDRLQGCHPPQHLGHLRREVDLLDRGIGCVVTRIVNLRSG